MRKYTKDHAKAGILAPLPPIECWENQFPDFQIEITIPEYTAICPKTGLPDFGTIIVRYVPERWCLELKSLKDYIHRYRSLGIFYENAVNRILRDLVQACKPLRMTVRGEFSPRGGIRSVIESSYQRPPAGKSRTARRRSP
ncbi:MAG: NADPH-dependent 7-cyano-7-deazaguanine reductase QueF [Acidobacteria bacterium]|nr:NADPH-dependent 7-cyano-7-deazaguanine reductase QueF [Acidobacteriota bacterium]